MLNIKLKNINIVNNLNDLNLKSLKIGDQILLIEKKEFSYTGMEFNNILTMFLNDIKMNTIYTFDGVDTNTNVYFKNTNEDNDEDNENPCEEEYKFDTVDFSSSNFSENYFLLNTNNKIKLERAYVIDIENDADRYSKEFDKFKEMSTWNDIFFSREVDHNDKKINFYLIIPLENNYLCCTIHNHVDATKYYWRNNELAFLINKDFTKYVDLDCNYDELFKAVDKLDAAQYSHYYEQWKKCLEANRFEIKDYLKNPEGIEKVYDVFNDISFLNKSDILKYFKPIYEDDEIEFIGHFNNRCNNVWNNIRYDYNYKKGGMDYNSETNSTLNRDKRKTKMIAAYLKKATMIDIYTGQIINCSNSAVVTLYEDAGGFILSITDEYRRNELIYYTKLDNIYVYSNEQEKKDINNRKKVLEALTATQ